MRNLLLLAALAAAGCGDAPPAPAPKPAEPEPELFDGVTLDDATFEQLDRVVKANAGKVVLIDVWATWCGPCVKKFPHLVELHRKYAGRGLAVVSLSTNSADERADAVAFLEKHNATFINLRLADTPANEKAWKDRYPIIPQPNLHVFNRRGEKVLSDPGKLRPEQVEELVEKLLAEK